MKKLLFFLMVAGTFSAKSQTSAQNVSAPAGVIEKYGIVEDLGWVIDVNLLGGALTKDITSARSAGNYLNSVNMNEGTLKFTDGTSFGGDVQLGYFFGEKRHWGIGTGIMYLSQTGKLTLDNFHAEYQSADFNGNTFRQVVSPNQPIEENLKITNVNIPILLKYKNRFSKRWGFTADGGLLINVQMKNKYTTNASFDYEAIYDIVAQPGGSQLYLYDPSPTPNIGDHLITKAFVNSVVPGGVQTYFNNQRELGASVGLGVKPNNNSGTVSYTAGSLGLFLQPSMSYYFSDRVALNLGVYYIYQDVNNTPQKGYQLTNNMGDYSSPMNNISKERVQSFGGNIGLRFFLGAKKFRPLISAEEAVSPTSCGANDGMIVLHAFVPNSVVKVDYKLNGVQQPMFTGVAESDGTVRIKNLPAGEYTDIVATVGKGLAKGEPVMLLDHPITVGTTMVNIPAKTCACNGSILLKSLQPNEIAVVSCDYNGTPSPSIYGKVSVDSSLLLRNVCAGTYSHIKLSVGRCSVTIPDINMELPQSPTVNGSEDTISIDPIYFDVDRSIIHEVSFPTLKTAAELLKESKDNHVLIEGHADTTGFSESNEVLSLCRAFAVKKLLVEMGVNPDVIRTVAYSDTKPAATNNTIKGRALNRRALVHIIREK